jgi:hypothetical protein
VEVGGRVSGGQIPFGLGVGNSGKTQRQGAEGEGEYAAFHVDSRLKTMDKQDTCQTAAGAVHGCGQTNQL